MSPSALAVLRLMTRSEFDGQEDGDLAGFLTFQDLIGHVGGATAEIQNFDPIVHELAGFDVLSIW
jgi:hypothetical protein